MISVIFAVDKNWLIGNDDAGKGLPWHYKDDMKYFKKQTLNKAVLMGDKTFFAMGGKLLPKRENWIVTFNKDLFIKDAIIMFDLKATLELFKDIDEELFVIGGKSIYEQSYEYADRLYITYIDAEHEGNVYLNKPDFNKFKKISEIKENILTFTIYERK